MNEPLCDWGEPSHAHLSKGLLENVDHSDQPKMEKTSAPTNLWIKVTMKKFKKDMYRVPTLNSGNIGIITTLR